MSSRALLFALVIASVLPSTAAPAEAARLKICFVSLNEPHELDAFRAALDPERFEFIDVRAVAAAAHPRPIGAPESDDTWLANACTPQMSCDVAVYSAEFAGRFFGKGGPSLSLQAMEEASCQARCSGLFRHPMEVFLLACNTLANKNEDSRTPQEYLRVLLDHGFDQASAERVVQVRYGPLGPSFRETLRRIFAGVPRIYGFSSVAPRGEWSAQRLAQYLRVKRDYAGQLIRTYGSTDKNEALLTAFKGTALTQTTGLSAAESGALDREHICDLYNESIPVAERLQIAYGMMLRPDALTFVPTLQVFLARHPPNTLSKKEKAVLAQIEDLESARKSVLDLVHQLDVSALKLELAHFAVLVGWLHQDEFHELAVNGASRLLHEMLTSEVVDIMCEITKHEPLQSEFSVYDVPPSNYRDAEGLRLLSCLAPADPMVSRQVIPQLDSTDPVIQEWAAHTLTRLFPKDEKTLTLLVPYLNSPSPAVSTRVRWIFEAQDSLPTGIEKAIQKVDPDLLRARKARLALVKR